MRDHKQSPEDKVVGCLAILFSLSRQLSLERVVNFCYYNCLFAFKLKTCSSSMCFIGLPILECAILFL